MSEKETWRIRWYDVVGSECGLIWMALPLSLSLSLPLFFSSKWAFSPLPYLQEFINTSEMQFAALNRRHHILHFRLFWCQRLERAHSFGIVFRKSFFKFKLLLWLSLFDSTFLLLQLYEGYYLDLYYFWKFNNSD